MVDMIQIVDLIDDVILNHENENKILEVKKMVNRLMDGKPLFTY